MFDGIKEFFGELLVLVVFLNFAPALAYGLRLWFDKYFNFLK